MLYEDITFTKENSRIWCKGTLVTGPKIHISFISTFLLNMLSVPIYIESGIRSNDNNEFRWIILKLIICKK